MNAFIRFNKGILRLPIGVQIWNAVLIAANLVVPLSYLERVEAQVVLATFFVSVFLMGVITGIVGFTRLLGAGHVLWFPLLYFLWIRLADIPSDDFFGLWVRALMALNAISLVVDLIDIARYVRGARAEMVEGL